MESIILISLTVLSVILVTQTITLRKLKKESATAAALINDLTFKHNDSMEFLGNRIAGIHYDLLKRSGRLIFHPHTLMKEVLSHPEAKQILIKRKMLRKRDKGPFEESLADRARGRKLSLEPILIALHDIENEL